MAWRAAKDGQGMSFAAPHHVAELFMMGVTQLGGLSCNAFSFPGRAPLASEEGGQEPELRQGGLVESLRLLMNSGRKSGHTDRRGLKERRERGEGEERKRGSQLVSLQAILPL